ncbi:MAG: 1-acyl-sn-glycerol-3-phosphate acyltransferase [Bacilli bacterium]|nr:1-acyl-sn-glycerol-3-phosphate acyltransferase [Bacilli bacterium]
MQKEQTPKILYYSDELNDDFAGTDINQKKLPQNFKYISKNIFYVIGKFLITVLLTPIIYLVLKIWYHQKFINRKALKRAKHTGYFVYGNHTNGCLDAFLPQVLTCPKKAYIIVNPDATSIPGIRTLVMMLGAIPLPTDNSLTLKYLHCIKDRVTKNKSVIMIYPEAHIWPYYTDIRNFKADSFIYPVEHNVPVFCTTNVYKKRKIGRRPKVVTYVDGPFYPDPSLTKKENMTNLRNKVYETMKNRVNSNPVYKYKYDYIKK